MREKLKDLLEEANRYAGENYVGKEEDGKYCGLMSDYLLSEGVIVPPCKVGQRVYVPWRWNGQFGIASVEVQEIAIYDSSNHLMFLIDMESDDEDYNQQFGGWKIEDSIGKTVFFTREEAEKSLKRRGK